MGVEGLDEKGEEILKKGFGGDANHMTEQSYSLSCVISSRIYNSRLSLIKNNRIVHGSCGMEMWPGRRDIFNSATLP